MNVGEVIKALRAIPCKRVELVTVIGTKSVITGFSSVGSWWNSDDKACLFRGNKHDKSFLLHYLEQFLTQECQEQTYYYTPEHTLYIEGYAGYYSGCHKIISVKYIQEKDTIQILNFEK